MRLRSQEIEILIREEEIILPDPYIRKNYIPQYFPYFGEMGTIIAQYKRAMLRHSEWYNSNLFYHFYQSAEEDGIPCGKLLKYGHSYIGYYDVIGDKQRPYVKVISHFMPYTMREGIELLKELLLADELIVFAVTPYLSNMLRKLGYEDSGINIPQYFHDQICLKHVWTNRPIDARIKKLFGF